jgi:hypothetical protein
MMSVINAVYIEAILSRLLPALSLPEGTPFMRLGPMLQRFVLDEAECLQRDAMSHPTFAILFEKGFPLTREAYLGVNDVSEDDIDAEQESMMPELFQPWAIDERVNQVMHSVDEDLMRRTQ